MREAGAACQCWQSCDGFSLVLTTPTSISTEVCAFLLAAGLRTRPQFLRFKLISQSYKPRMCLENCELESKKPNRQVIFGWVIWEDRNANFIDAEFHAVIEKANRLIDVTPRVDGEDRILFVSDEQRTAKRLTDNEWLTWANIKSAKGIVFEQTRPIRIVNTSYER